MAEIDALADKAKDTAKQVLSQVKGEVDVLKGVDWKSKGNAARESAAKCVETFRQSDWSGRVALLKKAPGATLGFLRSVWSFGVVGKAACVVGGVFVFSFGSCVFSSGDDIVSEEGEETYEEMDGESGEIAATSKSSSKADGEIRKNDDDDLSVACAGGRIDFMSDRLSFAVRPNLDVKKGAMFYQRREFRVLQWLEESGIALVTYEGESDLIGFAAARAEAFASALTGSDAIEERKDAVLLIRTDREYLPNAYLAEGVYVYEGIKSYESSSGPTSARMFREVDPDEFQKALKKYEKRKAEVERRLAEKKKIEEQRREKELAEKEMARRNKERVGNVLDTGESVVKSFCGFKFGHPEVDQESLLGAEGTQHRFFKTPKYYGDREWKLLKPFRWCDTVALGYFGEPPNRVLGSVYLHGKIPEKDEMVVKAETDTVAKMIQEKFGLTYNQEYSSERKRILERKRSSCARDDFDWRFKDPIYNTFGSIHDSSSKSSLSECIEINSSGSEFEITVENLEVMRSATELKKEYRDMHDRDKKLMQEAEKRRNDTTGADQL